MIELPVQFPQDGNWAEYDKAKTARRRERETRMRALQGYLVPLRRICAGGGLGTLADNGLATECIRMIEMIVTDDLIEAAEFNLRHQQPPPTRPDAPDPKVDA